MKHVESVHQHALMRGAMPTKGSMTSSHGGSGRNRSDGQLRMDINMCTDQLLQGNFG